MQALTDIAAELHERRESLSPLEWRTYAWAKASLAVLTAIRIEESLSATDASELPAS